jgi:cytochrome c55X
MREVAAAALALLPLAAGAQEPAPARQRELVHLLKHDCGSCHGLTLRGGLGPSLLPASLGAQEAEGIAQVILDGVRGTPMPPWRGELAPDEALWLAHRLKQGVLR